jgi:hypothetical protein
MITHSFLAAAYAEVKMPRASARSSCVFPPFLMHGFSPDKFGTQEVREPLLEGSRRQNFRECHRVRATPLKLAEILL